MSSLPRSHEQLSEGLRFSAINLMMNAVMGSLKFGVGMVTGSQALMAGALYSINDILASIAVNISIRFSSRPANKDYQFGFGRAEFLATSITGFVLAIAVTGVFLYQIEDLLILHTAPPHITAIGIAALSIGVSGYLYRRGNQLAEELSSPALHTTAEHSKADAVSSVAVLLGVGAATMGLHIVDRIVAVFEILHIVVLAGEFMLTGYRGLMDQSLSGEDLELLQDACKRIEGVDEVSTLRTRKGSRHAWVDIVVQVDSELSVNEAHELTSHIKTAVRDILGPTVFTQVGFRTHSASAPSPGLVPLGLRRH